MQCSTELVPPTAVTCSISLPFLSPTANNLIVAKSSLIQIFALKSVLSSEQSNLTEASTPRIARKERSYISKLVLIGQYPLSGTITGLGRVKPLRSKSGGELLIVSIKDAKLSLAQWDPENYSISTVSIHYYEREDLQGSPWAPLLSQCATHLTVDPGSRCAAYKFGARHLAILPFHQKGDELAIDDFDQENEVRPVQRRSSSLRDEGDPDRTQTPYAASFVLSLLTLDPTLIHPVHLAFLHGYREPTLAILSSQIAPSSSLLPERRDPMSFTVYTLDLEQKASTSLLSITGLPYDISRIIPLPSPIGGSLLLGNNEIIHVDQSGKANGVAVNEFAKESTDFPLVSQNDLCLKLEGCVVEQLSGSQGQMLIVLTNGNLALLNFQTDGRAVSSISVEPVPSANGGDLFHHSVSCASVIGRGRVFLGSEESDSIVLGWTSSATSKRRQVKNESTDELGLDDEFPTESEDENDLYAESSAQNRGVRGRAAGANAPASEYQFKIHDSLYNLSPLRALRGIQSCFPGEGADSSTVDLVAITGAGKYGALTRLQPEISLEEVALLGSSASHVWAFHSRGSTRAQRPDADFTNTILIRQQGDEHSHVYRFSDTKIQELAETDFEPDAGATVEVASLSAGSRILQVLPTELRAYDGDLSLAQILPLGDDTTDHGPRVLAASIAEPFILLLRDDRSVVLLRVDESGEIEEVPKPDSLNNSTWQSGALYDDAEDAFHLPLEIQGAEEEDVGTVLMFLLGYDGSLHIFRPPYLQRPLYVAEGMAFLPPYLTSNFSLGRGRSRANLIEILVARLGDSINQIPYLILRTSDDDVILYQPYQDSTKPDEEATLQFFRTVNHYIPWLDEDAQKPDTNASEMAPLRAIQMNSGLATVFVPGDSPRVIMKTAACDPKTIGIKQTCLRHIAAYTSKAGGDNILAIDNEGRLRSFRLPKDADITTGWVTQKLYEDDQIVAFDYHSATKRLILATSAKRDFRLPQDDELHPEWREESTTFLPVVDHDTLKLLDPETGHVTDTWGLDPYEVVMCIKVLSLEVSEITHVRRDVVCVGTAIVRGEDLLTQGVIYIFDVIKVVPEPDHPETGRRLKLLAKVKDRGAVTAVSSVGSEGFVLIAHGQKCYVRGLKEDGSLLPVAFMDTQCYVSVAKELRGTNMVMLGDAVKGLWFVGYTEDPYSMKLFGKGANRMEIAAAEYLPDGGDLYILAIDAHGTLHTYKFEPSNPQSLSGQRLLLMSTYNTGSYPSSMIMLPRTPTTWDRLHAGPSDPDAMDTSGEEIGGFQVLCSSTNGSLSLLTSLTPVAYRTLAALQSYLTTTLPHPLGLNPKAYRAVDADLTVGGRAVLDGDVLKRWMELGAWKRAESVARVGLGSEWEVRALLESVGVRGIGVL